MDANGRLHMGGFVGMSFDETGVLKEKERRAAEDREREREPGIAPEFMNRAARRRAAHLARKAHAA
jgi:hypothetical protein